MLDAGGGGGGGTPWALLTVDKMYELIKSADANKQWTLADGWKKSAELIASHRFQVQDYRDNLAAAWPPDRSQASAAYLDRLDAMIASLTETYEAALQNYDAVVAATGSIYQAQVQMEKIYQEYKNNETLLANFAAQQQQQQNNPTPTPSPSPSGGEQPPVAAGRQEALRMQASTMLSGVSTDLAQAQARIARPAKYEGKFQDDGSDQVSGGGYVPPPIPPITPIAPSDGSSSSSNRVPRPPGNTVPTPITPPGVIGQQPGLVLGGTNPPTLTPPTAGTNPFAPPLPGGTGPITNPGLLPPGNNFVPGGGPTLVPPVAPGTGRNVSADSALRSGGRLPEGARAMPPGGVIGQPSAVGIGQPGAGGRGGTGATRVNPVGGVIGESALGNRRSVNPGSGAIPSTAHATGVYGQGGQRSRTSDEAEGKHWDPDNPWVTAEGVNPVLSPTQEQKVDPGPAIGLS